MEPKLTYFVVPHRNLNVSTTEGHVITFEKGKPTHVPRAAHQAVINRGAIPCDAKGTPMAEPAESAVEVAEKESSSDTMVAPPKLTAEERAERIWKAIDILVEQNQSSDFANGTPKAEAVASLVKFRTDQKEVRKVFVEWRKSQADQRMGV
jgi:hypothetical protein